MHYLVEKTFKKRGLTDDLISKIENSTHTEQDNMGKMCAKLHDIHMSKKHIVLIPDFDMDGIMSGTVGNSGFNELGFNMSLYMRDVSRYDISIDDINNILAIYPDVSAIMTCDVGISCYDAIYYAKSLGLEVLITDHHIGVFNNGADAVVDPCAAGSTYSNVLGHSNICGAYVIWQVLMSYAELYGTMEQIDNIRRLIVFAGIGTVSDTMPMLCENRAAVKDSINILRWLMPADESIENYATFYDYEHTPLSGYHNLGNSQEYRSAFYGLQALMWYFRVRKCYDRHNIDEDFFGYMLGPMFNSVKRMKSDIDIAFGVFFDTKNAYDNIMKLYELNEQRKVLVSEYISQIPSIPQPFAPFLYLSDAPSGILGLLATKLVKSTGVPTLVVNRTPYFSKKYGMYVMSGSGRCPEGYDFMDAIVRLGLDKLNVKAAGHPESFGVSVPPDDSCLSSLYMALYTDITLLTETTVPTDPVHDADFIIGTGDECDIGFDAFELDAYLHEIRKYKPFGKGFFSPNVALMLTEDDINSWSWSITGGGSRHVRYSNGDGMDIIIWDGAGETFFCLKGFTALGHLEFSNYGGIESIVFIVDDLLEVTSDE